MKLHLVPARTGPEWVRSGLKTFWRQPLAFISLFFLFTALILIVSQVPLVGSVTAPILLPFMTLALMVATSVAHANEPGRPTSAAMFLAAAQACRAGWRPMAALGIVSAVYFMVAVGISAVVDDGLLARAYLLDETVTPEVAASRDFKAAQLLLMCLNLPLSLAMWHAPALVHWHRVAPVKSLFFSLVALFRNFGAFALFCVVWFGVFLAVSVALALVGTLLAGLGGSAMINAMVVGSALVLAAMPLSSTWFTFRDSFDAD